MNVLKTFGLKKQDWVCYGEWQQPPLSAQFWVHYYQQDIAQSMGLPSFNGAIIMINGYTVVFRNDLERLRKAMREAIEKKDGTIFRNFSDTSLQVFEDFLKIKGEVEESDSPELFDKFVKASRKVYTAWWLSVPFSDYFGDLLVQEADRYNVSSTEVVNYIPKPETLLVKQHREAYQIKKLLDEKGLLGESEDRAKTHHKMWKKIQKHVKEFEWVGTHHLWGEGLSVKKFWEELPYLQEPEVGVEEGAPRELSFMIDIAGQLAFTRTYAPEVFNLVAFKARQLMNGLAQKLGLSYEEFLLLTPDEIMAHFKQETKPEKKSLLKRKDNFCILQHQDEEVVVDDPEEVRALIKELIVEEDTRVNEVKGQSANKGHAKGTVKVFLVPERMEKMETGDILVTTMTTPDFVPLMKKAGAIVTDIGGLLSHAAIVSRELGKPCVIGTKISTRVFKDGDLVEVDAEKGVVRKVNK